VAFPLLSRAARDDRTRLAYAVHRLFDTTTVLGLGASIGLVVGAATIIDVMAGSGFRDAAPALRIQGVTLVASYALAPIGFALLSLHAHRSILIVNAMALATMLAAVGALGAALGAEGAALGTVIGEWGLAAGYLVALQRMASEVTPSFDRAARGLVAAAPCFALALVSGVPAWAMAALALALYALLLVVLRAVPDELVELMPRRRARG
jgi:O-antigen/teichoic acid export membrane protein